MRKLPICSGWGKSHVKETRNPTGNPNLCMDHTCVHNMQKPRTKKLIMKPVNPAAQHGQAQTHAAGMPL